MTIYVDPLLHYPHVDGFWCHMMTDGDLEELHLFAEGIGMRREWFQDKPRYPHYDLNPTLRERAVTAGAVELSTIEMLRQCTKLDV